MMMRLFSNVKDFYNDINGATLTGAIDVIVVEQPDGTFSCSPFHVRFGKLGVLRSKEKVVDIEVNGTPLDIHMKLGESGEAFFVEDLEGEDESEIPEHLATSPIPVSEIEKIFQNQGRRRSFDLHQLDNESNSYEKRRYTADNEMINNRTHLELDFLKRQIGLGNIDGTSVEDVTLSLTTGSKRSDEDDISRSQNDVSETIFKMDSLEESPPNTNKKLENGNPSTSNVTGEISSIKPSMENSDTKNNKKKRKKMRKKNSARKTSNNSGNLLTSPSSDVVDNNTPNESITDRSSMESNNCSETEILKDAHTNGNKTEIDGAAASTHQQQHEQNLKKVETDFHFFSDTELTTGNAESRSSSPAVVESVQSDSEIEMKLLRCKDGASEPSKSWEWGGFPNVTPTTSPVSEVPTKEAEQKSMLSSVFSFMKSKHSTTQSRFAEGGGVYLSEITSGDIDRTDAELYFNQRKIEERDVNDDIDMDCESGNGPSLTHSPNSAEGCKSIDSDFEEQTKLAQSYSQDIALSLSGWDPQLTEERFNEHLVSFTDLCNNPGLLENPKLVAKINKNFYSWKIAAPMLVSLTCFGRPLLQSCLDQLSNSFMPIQEVKEKQEDKSPSYKFWHHWTRSKSSRETTPLKEEDSKTIVAAAAAAAATATGDDKDAGSGNGSVEEVMAEVEEETVLQSSIEQQKTSKESIIIQENLDRSMDKCRKTLRLSSKQIGMLNLRDGMNEIEFSVTTAYQGTTRCQCHLYKWKWDDKIVISDIDGTITKSDVLGHILPIVGKDWAQSGVAQLFNKIKNNGYKLLYLSARAIGQARITREYLKSIKQGDMYMPDGPILLNPTSLITAFHREVIEKKPEAFKISCMSDIKALFPSDSEPFYAGYGNRINDVWAYRAVGIPIHRIFTINPKGELKHELTQTFQSSYSNMSILVDQMFPSRLEAANDYSHFSYWREPIIALDPIPEII